MRIPVLLPVTDLLGIAMITECSAWASERNGLALIIVKLRIVVICGAEPRMRPYRIKILN